MSLKRWSEKQLKFDLDGFDEVEADAAERRVAPDVARQMSEASRLAFEAWKRQQGGEEPINHSVPEWVAEYNRLRDLGWPWRIACYIAWASAPKDRRWPETVKQLATEILGLSGPRVIYTWREKYASIDTMVAMLQAAPLWEHRADVMRALVDSAIKPDYKYFNDRKLFLEMTGDYTPRSQLDLGKSAAAGLEGLSDAELAELAGMQGIGRQVKDQANDDASENPEDLNIDELDDRLKGCGAG